MDWAPFGVSVGTQRPFARLAVGVQFSVTPPQKGDGTLRLSDSVCGVATMQRIGGEVNAQGYGLLRGRIDMMFGAAPTNYSRQPLRVRGHGC